MLKIVLLSMVLSGLQALPISRGLTPSRIEDIVPVSRHHRGPTPWRTEDSEMVADTEASRRFILDLSSGKVLDYLGKMDRTGPLGHGHGEMDRRHLLTQNVEDAPVQFSGGGWVRVESAIPHGFRQGTEPSDPDSDRDISYTLPHGFRQGTEPSDPDSDRNISYTLPHGFRQGTEPSDPDSDRDISYTLPHGFRQGTEPSDPDSDRDISYTLPHGFRQGTEPSDPDSDRDISYTLPHGFRQGTEPSDPDSYREISYTLPHGFRQGTEPSDPDSDRNEGEAMSFSAEHVGTFQEDLEPSNLIMSGFRPDMEPLMVGFERSNQFPVDLRKECVGEVIYGRCYTFNPTPLPFLEAQDSCRRLNPNAELASVTNEDLHSRLVSMVTNGGRKEPVITWLGGVVKGQGQWLWLDGSEWSYSAWTPGQTNTNRAVCVEMFRTGESWTAADCDLSRASICSSPAAASTLHL
ncbi:unnamed protein product [Knipowitschia caucasica]